MKQPKWATTWTKAHHPQWMVRLFYIIEMTSLEQYNAKRGEYCGGSCDDTDYHAEASLVLLVPQFIQLPLKISLSSLERSSEDFWTWSGIVLTDSLQTKWAADYSSGCAMLLNVPGLDIFCPKPFELFLVKIMMYGNHCSTHYNVLERIFRYPHNNNHISFRL